MVSPTEVKAHLKIAADAKLGEHAMRLRTASGISDLRNFYVGPFPTVVERTDVNPDPKKPRDRQGPADAAGEAARRRSRTRRRST